VPAKLKGFERNLSNWLNLDPAEAMYHRFQGMLESQIATLQICEVITRQGAVKLLTRMCEARREKYAADAGHKGEGLRLV